MLQVGKPVLIVIDDERLLLRAIVRMLAGSFHVVPYERASAALAFLEGGAECAAILTDVRLGDMSGKQLYEELQRIRPELAARVIFMTGSDSTPLFGDFLQRHADRVLLKPFMRADVLRILGTVLSGDGP